ncbi:MAG TPA: hypothetical protein VHE30_21885 [Polyangiaceae bacterium]|nr:hypothetical protein [Polyangiaceae bacterium]
MSTAAVFTFACGGGAGHVPSPSSQTEAVDFSAAPSGSEREELTLDSFDLEPGGEVYKCQNFANPFGRDVALLQTQSVMSEGSHHLAVFRISDAGNGALEDCSGLEFHATVHAAQTPVARMQFPDGVGAFLAGTEGLRLNAHYINLGNETIHANVQVALDWVDASTVPVTAAQIYLNDSTLDIPPGKGSGGGTLSLPAGLTGVKLLSAQSHMHRRGVAFESSLADGTELYDADTWSEPPVKRYEPPVSLPDGAAINWHCDFVNETAQNLTFGESAGTNEMCVFTGFYYPAPGGQTIVGDVAFGKTSLTK